MKIDNVSKALITFAVILGVSLGLFQFWPFTVAFFLSGAFATIIINVTTGYMINFLAVLIIEFALIIATISVALYIGRQIKD